jgi:predicted nucleotidyltransferase
MMTDHSRARHELAQRVADALPPDIVEEVILTGSVSRGAADDLSDIEMLIVTAEQLDVETCFAYARAAGLSELDTWGAQDVPARRVFGYRDEVPIELIWWSRAYAESRIDALFHGEAPSTADAIANGLALRTSGSLARWQARLRAYPPELAAALIEEAALTWGGYAPAGLLTIARPRERLALVERMLDDAARVLRIVYALNRVWQPTHKRLETRVAPLALKPDRLAERIEEALTEPDPRRALLIMTRLQAETAALAPDGPNINRARRWLAEAEKELTTRRRAGSVEDS